MVPTIGCRDLFSRLGDDEVVVVDCREGLGGPHLAHCIPGAVRIPLAELLQAADILPDDELIVLCGEAEDGSDARQAYRILRMKGRDAVCLDGGIVRWMACGYLSEPYTLIPRARAMAQAHPLKGAEALTRCS